MRAGAHGFLHKEISPEGLVRALRGVVQGEAPLSRDLASLMIDALHGYDERTHARDRAAVLSSREREVLDLIAQGARNKQIAALLIDLRVHRQTARTEHPAEARAPVAPGGRDVLPDCVR